MQIAIGQQVNIRPEWMDKGDEDYSFTAISEPNFNGNFKVRVMAKMPGKSDFASIMELHVSQVF